MEAMQTSPRPSTARSAVWNYAGYACQILLNFGLTAYIVRNISVNEYGLFLLVMSLSATLNLLDLGISGVLVQAYVYASKDSDSDRLSNLASTAFVALAALGTVGVAIFCGIALLLPGPFRIPPVLQHQAAMIFVIAAFIIQVRLPGAALRQVYEAHHRFDRINQVQLGMATLQFALSIYVIWAGYGIVGLAVVQLIVAVMQGAIFYLGLRFAVPATHLNPLRFRRKLLGSLLRDGKWAFMVNATAYLVEIGIWAILGSLGSMTEVALYGIAMKAPNQLSNLADKGAEILLPVFSGFSAEQDDANLRRVYLKAQQLIFGAVLPFVVLGSFFAGPLIQLWAGKQYLHAATTVRWLLVAVLAHGVAYSSDLILYASGNFRRAAWIGAVGGLVILGGAAALVPRYGASGVAVALVISQLVIDCGWFTVEACKISRTTPRALARRLSAGLGWPVMVLAGEIALILSLRPAMSPLWQVIAATLSGGVYLLIWGLRTALPLYRNRAELVA